MASMQCVLLYCIVLLFAGFRWHATCSHEFRPNETARSLEKNQTYGCEVRSVMSWKMTTRRTLWCTAGPKFSMRSPNSWEWGRGLSGGRSRLKFEKSKFSIRLKIWKLAPTPPSITYPYSGVKYRVLARNFSCQLKLKASHHRRSNKWTPLEYS